MTIRNDFQDFPLSGREDGIWYFLVEWETRKTSDYYNVSGKKELVSRLERIMGANAVSNYQLFGVWTGRWRTDIFKIPIEEAYKELSRHFR